MNMLKYPEAKNLPQLLKALATHNALMKKIGIESHGDSMSFCASVAWCLRERVFSGSLLRLGVVFNFDPGPEVRGVFQLAFSILNDILKLPESIKKLEIVMLINDPAFKCDEIRDPYKREGIVETEIITISGPLNGVMFNPHFRGIDSLFFFNCDLYFGQPPEWVGNDGILVSQTWQRLHDIGMTLYGLCPHPDVLAYESGLMRTMGLPVETDEPPYWAKSPLFGTAFHPNSYLWKVTPPLIHQDKNLNFAEWLVTVGKSEKGTNLVKYCQQKLPAAHFLFHPELMGECVADGGPQADAYRELKARYDRYLEKKMP